MKILFILDLYKPHIWWVEILFENIISRLEKQWHKIIILTSKFSKDLEDYKKYTNNVEIYRVGHNRYDFMFYSIFKWIKIAKKCDLIHTTTYNSAISAWIIWKLSHKKIVLTVHEIFWKLWYKFLWWKWFFFKKFEDLIFKFSFDKYLCVSNYTKNSIRLAYGLDDKKLLTVHNWIDYNIWDKNNYKKDDIEQIKKQYWLKDSFVGMYYGRPGISKGLEFYIQAIPYLIKKIPNFKAFLIVSKNDKKRVSYIEKLISGLNLEKYIIWTSWISYNKLWNYILACDIVVVPSLAEWFGFSAVETCSLNKNLVVSEIASLPEVVSWKINFSIPWDERSISQSILNFYNKKYLEIPSKKFYWDDNIEKTLKVYNELLDE